MNRSHVRSWWLVGLALTLGESRGDEVVVEVEPSPGSTIAAGQVDLTGALRFCKKGPIDPAGISGHVQGSGEAVPVQFVPGVGFDPRGNVRGLLLVKTSGEKPFRLELKFGEPAAPSGDWDGRIERAGYELKHERGVSGGMPRGIVFKGDGKRLETLSWNNRLHHRETGSFFLAQDDEATVERIASGPLCETVRVSARFVQGKSWPASEPKAVYHWHYLREEPLVLVEAAISQREAYQWHEVHFLEPNYRGEALPRWAGGDPEASGSFTATRKSFPQRDWGVVHDGRNAIGMFDSGQVLLYDGGGATYIQARGDEAWSSWDGLERRFSGWVWLGAAEDPPASVRPWADRSPTSARMRIGVDSVNLRLETAERASASLPVEDQRKSAWRFRAARQLAAQGKHDEALATAEGDLSPPARVISAGDLNLVLDKSAEGLRVLDLFDAATGRGFVTETPAPLFTIQLRDTETKRNIVLTAENGWGRVDWSEEGDEIIWSEPKEAGLEGLAVLMECNADVQSSSLRCGLSVKPPKARFGLWRVAFPGVEVADLGDAGAVFYPQAAGIVRDQAWGKAFRFGGT